MSQRTSPMVCFGGPLKHAEFLQHCHLRHVCKVIG